MSEKRGVIKLHAANKLQTVRLKRPSTIIGRQKADIIIDDEEVSASHCQIHEIEGEHFIFDMNSTNGTFVNNKKVIKAKLAEGDSIQIGKSKLQFNLVGIQEASKTPFFDKFRDQHARKSVFETLLTDNIKKNHRILKVTYPNQTIELLHLQGQETLLGKDSFFGNFMCDEKISDKHLLVRVNNQGDVYIEDQKSKHGTFVNNKEIKDIIKILNSDIIKIGSTKIQIISEK